MLKNGRCYDRYPTSDSKPNPKKKHYLRPIKKNSFQYYRLNSLESHKTSSFSAPTALTRHELRD